MSEPSPSASLPTTFADRDALIAHVRALCPWAEGDASPIVGGATAAQQRLQAIDPLRYAATRNFGDGKVSRLSPYLRHGVLSLNAVRNAALAHDESPARVIKFIQELAWRDFWQRVYAAHPDWIWQDIEPYKTGFVAHDYADTLPQDIAEGRTGVACIDAFIAELIDTGYLHNHARMYVASYTVHARRVQWQAGARWFLHHLLDGDPASNNLSWQWVASTFSQKPYIFNLENVAKYFGAHIDTSHAANAPLDASYETLARRWFPNLGDSR
jgi:deoxyribodipyrimidine photo-lyase